MFRNVKNCCSTFLKLQGVTIRAWRRKQSEEHLVLGLGQDLNRLVFTRQDGEPYNPRTISKEFSRTIKRLPITQISFHGLRHTHITHLLRDNVHIKVVAARAGHASVSITLDVYGHLIDNMDAAAANVIDGWFAVKED